MQMHRRDKRRGGGKPAIKAGAGEARPGLGSTVNSALAALARSRLPASTLTTLMSHLLSVQHAHGYHSEHEYFEFSTHTTLLVESYE